jgi:hypothetical protein
VSARKRITPGTQNGFRLPAGNMVNAAACHVIDAAKAMIWMKEIVL